jgi:RHS repeat-associated protein
MIRPTTLTYPNARAITIGYGTAGGINDSASRVDNLTDGATTLVNYAYLGMRTVVQTTYPQPSIQHTLLGSFGGNSPAGDIYWGLDLFGRIIDSRWYNTGTSADLDRIKYGYDRASNRIWRQNPVATAAGASFDEHYSNDGLERLRDMQRGTLNGTNTAIASPNFAQCWTLDPTGNWRGFDESTTGSLWTLNQTRTANSVNEITGVTNTVGSAWVAPSYDAAGNMTTMPQPGTPTSSYGAAYDAWSRLVTITDAGNSLQKYQYDARNFRTQILTYTAGVLSETRHCYFTRGWRCIEERVDAGTTAERQFVWGSRYIDDSVLRDRGSERLYTMQDANWNVTSIANASATVQERYAYSPYGVVKYLSPTFDPRSSSAFSWETLYCAYRFDITTFLHHVRHRYYHPTLGNWCHRDPLTYISGGGLHVYAKSSPLTFLDPSGLAELRDLTRTGPEFTWSFDNTNCVVELAVNMCLQIDGAVAPESPLHTDEYRSSIESSIRNLTESAFNEGTFSIFPQNAGCPCSTGWTPTIRITFDCARPGVNVNFSDDPNRQSFVNTDDGINARLDVGDFEWQNDFTHPLASSPNLNHLIHTKFIGKIYRQLTVPHEVGHMIGLRHPGSPFLDTYDGNGSPADLRDFDYWLDAPSLMGVGMEIRSSYFGSWAQALENQGWRCAPLCSPFTVR